MVRVSEATTMAAGYAGTKGYKGLPMEGIVARRYARLRSTPSQIEEWRREAVRLTEGLPSGARILEVAPGPGFFSIELARPGRYEVAGLDISQTFVDIAEENAWRAGVGVDFYLGDVAEMEFPDASFDLIVCQAAFKNFSRPRRALLEMHRVLRPGGRAVIQDMRKDASRAGIRDEVRGMHLSAVGALMTRWILGGLRRRAYTTEQFCQMAEESAFHGGRITTSGIGIEVRLTKRTGPG
jgi:ubiquinone/menaquinone biosynthesis C-methylase UbiE